MSPYRVNVIDEEAGTVGLLGNINENGNKNWFATRLKIEKGKQISEIESLIVRNISMATAQATEVTQYKVNTEPHSLKMEVLPENKRLSRGELVALGDSYFTGLDTNEHGRNIPLDPDCQRCENGMVTTNNPDFPKGSMQWMGCKDQFGTGFSLIVIDIRKRRFEVVDLVTGLAFGFGYFDHDGSVAKMPVAQDGKLTDVDKLFRQPFSFIIAEIFKVKDGKIRPAI